MDLYHTVTKMDQPLSWKYNDALDEVKDLRAENTKLRQYVDNLMSVLLKIEDKLEEGKREDNCVCIDLCDMRGI